MQRGWGLAFTLFFIDMGYDEMNYDSIQKTLTFNIAAKNKLAKLLSNENIIVEHRFTNVPSFDLASRVLTLPLWNDMRETLLDRLIGHEVSHAVFTPAQKFIEMVKKSENDPELGIFLQFVNLVEDIRIEKLILRKYPGLLPQFVKSAQDLMDRDYFQLENKKISEMNPADRINLYFKVNVYDRILDIPFDKKESDLMDELSAVETWDETLRLAKKLMEFCKKESPQMFDEMSASAEGKEGDKEGDGKDGQNNQGGTKKIVIITQEQWDKAREEAAKMTAEEKKRVYNNANIKIHYIDAGISNDPSSYIISYNNVLEDLATNPKVEIKKWEHFKSSLSPYISSMYQEFQRKKSAKIWLNRQVNVTGDLDMNSLFKYKYSGDIFKSETIVKKGKNHTIVMFVDFSGSMSEVMGDVLEQLYLMVLFCRRAQIKHIVYAFCDDHSRLREPVYDPKKNAFVRLHISAKSRLVELYNSSMKDNEFELMSNNLANIIHNRIYNRYNTNLKFRNSYLRLNGTPLNDSLMIAYHWLPKIKEAHKSDIINSIFITDGDSNSSSFIQGNDTWSLQSTNDNRNFIQSKKTGKQYVVDCVKFPGPYGVTCSLVNMIREEYGIKMINFHIVNGSMYGPNVNYLLERYCATNDFYGYRDKYIKTKRFGVFGKKCYAWDAAIVSDGSLLRVDVDSSSRETKQILNLVVDLIS